MAEGPFQSLTRCRATLSARQVSPPAAPESVVVTAARPATLWEFIVSAISALPGLKPYLPYSPADTSVSKEAPGNNSSSNLEEGQHEHASQACKHNNCAVNTDMAQWWWIRDIEARTRPLPIRSIKPGFRPSLVSIHSSLCPMDPTSLKFWFPSISYFAGVCAKRANERKYPDDGNTRGPSLRMTQLGVLPK